MNKQILIAEDEPYIIEALSFLLDHSGYAISAVNDGNTVIEKTRESHPDLIILDLMLPNKNGFEILKELRSDDELKLIPVLMLTAKGQEQDRSTAEQLGVDAFITKPFSNRDVLDVVENLIKQESSN